MDRRAVVWGARTPLGSAIAEHLLQSGFPTTVTRRWSDEPTHHVARGAIDAVVDLDNPDSLTDALVGRNWVFWPALPESQLPAEVAMARGVRAARKLVAAAREAGVDRAIVTTSAGICWEPGREPITERNRYLPGSASDARLDAYYAVHQAFEYATADGFDTVTLATALRVGAGVSPIGIALPNDGRRVDVVGVKAAARAAVKAAQRAGWGELYLLGGGGLDRGALREVIPAPRARGFLGRGGDDSRRHLVVPGVRVDASKAIEELDFDPNDFSSS